MTVKNRAAYVDLARGIAISLGLFSHVMLTSGAWEALKDASPMLYGIRLLTRFATPTFILLFGLSLELAYLRRWHVPDGPPIVRRRLARRAVKCYGAMLLIGAAGVVGGVVLIDDLVLGAFFMAPVFNADIFAFYTVGMIAALALIPLRVRLGILPTLAITLSWWPIAWIASNFAPEDGRLAFFLSRIFGIGVTYGPSVLHAIPLVVCGMAVGRFVSEARAGGATRDARRDVLVIVALGLSALLLLVVQDGLVGTAVNFVSATEYRNTNHYGYFVIGLAVSLGVLLTAYLLTEIALPGRTWQPGPFGAHSLMAFTSGNVVINLLGARLATDSPFSAMGVAAGLIVALWLGLRCWLWWREGQRRRASARLRAG